MNQNEKPGNPSHGGSYHVATDQSLTLAHRTRDRGEPATDATTGATQGGAADERAADAAAATPNAPRTKKR